MTSAVFLTHQAPRVEQAHHGLSGSRPLTASLSSPPLNWQRVHGILMQPPTAVPLIVVSAPDAQLTAPLPSPHTPSTPPQACIYCITLPTILIITGIQNKHTDLSHSQTPVYNLIMFQITQAIPHICKFLNKVSLSTYPLKALNSWLELVSSQDPHTRTRVHLSITF